MNGIAIQSLLNRIQTIAESKKDKLLEDFTDDDYEGNGEITME